MSPRLHGQFQRTPRLAAVGACLVLAAGAGACRVGPTSLIIETGGEPVEGFVVQPVLRYGAIHSSQTRPIDSLIVSSEETVVIPAVSRGGLTFDGVLISVFHPAFEYEWTGVEAPGGGRLQMPPIRPDRWSNILSEQPEISLSRVDSHLERLEQFYLPVILEASSQPRLRQFLPELEALVEAARYQPGDDGRGWRSEEEARAGFRTRLAAISEKLP